MQLKVTKLNDFLNEALPLSLAKKVMKIPRKKEVNNILNKVFTKDRMYVDIGGKKLEAIQKSLSASLLSYKPIASFLESKDVKIVDFVNNIAKEDRQNNPTKITRILSKLGRQDLLNFYENDSARKSLQKLGSSSYKIVISKSKYDIAGMSTDRSWKSCMRLDTSPQAIKQHSGMRGADAGINARFVKEDIREGTIIAYFIDSKDTNINKPLGRVLIKPFTSSETNDIIWVPENVCYGDISTYKNIKTIFLDFIKDWVKENINSVSSKITSGEFHKNPKLYNDDSFDAVNYENGEVTKAQAGYSINDIYGNPMIYIVDGSDSDNIDDYSGNTNMYTYEWDFYSVKIKNNGGDDVDILNPDAYVAELEGHLNSHDWLDSYIGEISEEDSSSELSGWFTENYLYPLVFTHWFYDIYDTGGNEIKTTKKIISFMKDVITHKLLDEYFIENVDWKEERKEVYDFIKANINNTDAFHEYRMENRMSVYGFLDSFLFDYNSYKVYKNASYNLDYLLVKQFKDYEKFFNIAKEDYTGLSDFFKNCTINVDLTNLSEIDYYEEDKEMRAICESFPGNAFSAFEITSIQGGVVQLNFKY